MFICYSRILKKKNVYKPGVQKTQVKLLIKKKKRIKINQNSHHPRFDCIRKKMVTKWQFSLTIFKPKLEIRISFTSKWITYTRPYSWPRLYKWRIILSTG